MHEHVADRLARHEQPAGADRRQPCNTFWMPHRQLGGNPAADAMAGELKAMQAGGVEQLEIVEDDVVDSRGLQLVRAIAAGMRGREHARIPRQPLMEWQEITGDSMHVGEAMQIDERRSVTRLGDSNLASADVDHAHAHFAISGARAGSGNSRANSLAESALSRGATSVANSRMLLRASASCMLPRWNWIRRLPTLEWVRMSMMRR